MPVSAPPMQHDPATQATAKAKLAEAEREAADHEAMRDLPKMPAMRKPKILGAAPSRVTGGAVEGCDLKQRARDISTVPITGGTPVAPMMPSNMMVRRRP